MKWTGESFLLFLRGWVLIFLTGENSHVDFTIDNRVYSPLIISRTRVSTESLFLIFNFWLGLAKRSRWSQETCPCILEVCLGKS